MLNGDIVVFKRQGFVSGVIGWLIQRFEKDWDGWGWHMAIAVEYHKTKGWLIAESIGKGVTLSWLDCYDRPFKSYNWFNKEISAYKIRRFLADRAGCRYDVSVYIFTLLQYLVLHWFNHPLPRVLDRKYTCWELVFEFCREMGKPIQAPHKYPMITDFMRHFP